MSALIVARILSRVYYDVPPKYVRTKRPRIEAVDRDAIREVAERALSSLREIPHGERDERAHSAAMEAVESLVTACKPLETTPKAPLLSSLEKVAGAICLAILYHELED